MEKSCETKGQVLEQTQEMNPKEVNFDPHILTTKQLYPVTSNRSEAAVGYATMDLSYIDFITDINCWGVFIQSDKNVPVGESVLLTIPLHGEEQSIKVLGEVMWSGSQGMGIKFNMGINTAVISSLLN